MAQAAVEKIEGVRVVGFDNLTIELAHEHNAGVLIRGLRAVSDFEYELQHAKAQTCFYKLFHCQKSASI